MKTSNDTAPKVEANESVPDSLWLSTHTKDKGLGRRKRAFQPAKFYRDMGQVPSVMLLPEILRKSDP